MIPEKIKMKNDEEKFIFTKLIGARDYITKAFGVEMTPRTCVKTEAGHYSTSREKIFTAGDMHRGQSLVVWAIREGNCPYQLSTKIAGKDQRGSCRHCQPI